MLTEKEMARLNELARKKKSEGLTEKEAKEQGVLREKYLKAFRKNFRQRLENIEIEYVD